MAKKRLTTLGRIEQAQQETQKKNVESKNQTELEVSYLEKQIEAYDAYKDMLGAEKNTDKYKKFKEAWQEKRKSVENFESEMPDALLEEYSEKYNRSEKADRKRLEELLAKSMAEGGQNETSSDKTETRVAENWRSLWGVGPSEKLPASVTAEELEKFIEMTDKTQGKENMAYAYAQSLRENLEEQPAREEAEEHRDEIEEAEAGEKQPLEELNAEKKRKVEVFEEPNDPEVGRLEKVVSEAEKEVEEKKEKATLGSKFKDGVKKLFDKFKKEKKVEEKTEKTEEPADTRTPEEIIASGEEYHDESGFIHNQKEGKGYKKVSGFFAERVKGFVGGFGWWESHQAEKFRLGTKEAGRDAKAQAQLLEQEEGLLDLDEAWEEAKEVESKRAKEEKVFKEKYGADDKAARDAAIVWLSVKISERKREYNQKIEDKIVALALAKLEEKLKNKSWVEEYKAAYGGAVVSPEKMQKVEERIREKIGELRKGQSKKDLVDFIKLSRQSLDKNWWHRYIYTAVDAVLAGFMMKWIVGKYLGGKAAEVVAGKGGTGKVLEWGMKDHVWGETKRFLIQKGVDPTDSNILKYARIVAEDSGVAVKEWGLSGKILDTQMPAGYLLKFTRVAAELAKLGF